MLKLIISLAILSLSQARVYDNSSFLYDKFPDTFEWSSATSAYQIEGAWNIDGKGPSIWDVFTRKPGAIVDGTNGDVACDSYHKYKEDIQLLKAMGVQSYRFSISWPRILPNGTGEVNMLGIKYYTAVIDELIANNIKPMITLFHWDLPQALEDRGGFLNEEAIVEPFANFSRICFQHFGEKVKNWITFNEPYCSTYLAYGVGSKAPGIKGAGNNSYIAGHALLKAHARSWHIYDTEFRPTQKGKIGITLNGGWFEPTDPSKPEDLEASERAMQFEMGWFGHPVFVGDYPRVMRETIANNSRIQGFSQSRLPEFTQEEIAYIRGTSDFFGLNTYGATLTAHNPNPDLVNPSYDNDKGILGSKDPAWIKSGSSWLNVTPWSMRRMLNWIKESYNSPEIYVTENGVSDNSGTTSDASRVYFYREYINSMLKAIKFDGCRVIGYSAWSLLDNFEWERGYVERFGLHYVNFTDPARPRTAKDSAKSYSKIIKDNGFVEESTSPTSTTIPNTTPNRAGRIGSQFTIALLACIYVLLNAF